MRLSDLVVPGRVVLPLRETTLAGAAGELVERLAATGAIADREKLQARVSEERGEDIVALGDRAFLTHYRTDAVEQLVLAIGIARSPVARDVGEGEGQQAHIVLLFLAPPRLAARYLQVLGAFARLLSRPQVVERMLAASTPEEVAALPELRETELPPQLTVREMMTERPRTTRPDTPLRDAARAMVRGGIGALPVVEADGTLVGMLSERELMRHMLSNTAFLGATGHRPESSTEQGRRTVRDVMTRQVLCVSPDEVLAEVASLMANKDVDRVPVVREGRLVGFLTRGDIVRKLIGS
ncbi:MAG TPA: CBS domain-containing protein [Gemmatimonadaceae bacterium]|nr:CBS domain-containing protein [Gemmatimonadaceae bacterium]